MVPAMAPSSTSSRPRLRQGLALVLTVVVLGLLLTTLDLAAVGRTMGEADPTLLTAAVALSLGGRFVLDTARWRWLLARLDCPLAPGEALLLQSVSMPLRLVTPAKSGLLLCALYLEERRGMPLSRGLSSVFLEKLHNLAFYLGAIALLPLLGAASPAELPLALPRAWALLGTVAVVAGILATGALLRWSPPSGLPLLPPRLRALVRELGVAFSWLSPRQQLGFLAATTGILGLEFVEFQLVFAAVGLDLSLLGIGYVMALVVLVSALPLTIGGLGTREAAALVLLAPVAPPEQIAAVIALLYAEHWLLPSALGAAGLPTFLRRMGGWTTVRSALGRARARVARPGAR